MGRECKERPHSALVVSWLVSWSGPYGSFPTPLASLGYDCKEVKSGVERVGKGRDRGSLRFGLSLGLSSLRSSILSEPEGATTGSDRKANERMG